METKIPKTGRDVRGDDGYNGSGGADSSPEALQHQFDAPSVLGRDGARRMQEDLNGPADRRDLKAQEESAAGGSAGKIDDKEKSFASGGGFFRNEGPSRASKIKGRITNFSRRRIAIIAVTGLVGGGGIFGVSILQGPFQVIQLSQQLQNLMSQRKDEDDSRILKIGRYVYYYQKDGSGVQNIRMGRLANGIADKVDAKMKAAGVETAYLKRTGFRAAIIVDPNLFDGGNLDRYRKFDSRGNIDIDATQKAVVDGFEKEYGIRPQINDDGRLLVNSVDLDRNTKAARAFDRVLAKNAGYSGKTSAIVARLMGKRAGLSWHPIRKADRRINIAAEARYTKWKEDRKNKLKTGTAPNGRVSSGNESDPKATEQEKNESREAAKQAGDTIREAQSTDTSNGSSVEKFQNSTKVKIGAGAASVTGVVCVIKSLDDEAGNIKEAQVILPAMRMAGDYMSLGSQVQSGDDLDMEQVGYFVKQLSGKSSVDGKTTSWSNSSTYRSTMGKSGGDPPTETLSTIPEGSPFSFINKGAPGQFANAACSTAGVIATTILGVATGGLLNAASGALTSMALAPALMGQAADWISGNALNLSPVGSELGNTLFVGGGLMARYQGASGGGRPLDPQESAQYKQYLADLDKKELNEKSLGYRLFALKDSRSLISRTVSSYSRYGTSTASFAQNFINSYTNLFGGVSRLISPKATASSDKTSVGSIIQDVGFTQDELNNSKVANPFANAEDVIRRILPSNANFIDRAKKCWGVGVDPTSYDVTNINAGSPTFKDMEAPECRDKSEDFLQFRIYIKDSQLITGLACFENDEAACGEIGMATSSASASAGSEAAPEKVNVEDLGKNSVNISCAAGTKDLGVVTTKYTGEIKKESGPLKIRLCQVRDIPGGGNNADGAEIDGGATVDARVSGVWVALAKAAKTDGVQLSASSSFRLADSCGGGGDGRRCASPGKSLHQSGLAIDFADMPGVDPDAQSCATRMKADTPGWRWMENNSARYGIKQYSAEAWQWDFATMLPNRCGGGG